MAKGTAQQLQEAKTLIEQLERQLRETKSAADTTGPSAAEVQALREEIKAQQAIVSKTKKVATNAEMEVDRLRAQLRQIVG